MIIFNYLTSLTISTPRNNSKCLVSCNQKLKYDLKFRIDQSSSFHTCIDNQMPTTRKTWQLHGGQGAKGLWTIESTRGCGPEGERRARRRLESEGSLLVGESEALSEPPTVDPAGYHRAGQSYHCYHSTLSLSISCRCHAGDPLSNIQLLLPSSRFLWSLEIPVLFWVGARCESTNFNEREKCVLYIAFVTFFKLTILFTVLTLVRDIINAIQLCYINNYAHIYFNILIFHKAIKTCCIRYTEVNKQEMETVICPF